jgi:hypothetical protein
VDLVTAGQRRGAGLGLNGDRLDLQPGAARDRAL